MKEKASKELRKELVSYISVYYDKKNLKEQNEIADEILKVFNKDKKFRNKVEKMAKKIKDDKKIKKGGRRKTRKKKKGGNGDWFNITNLGYFAAGMVICYGLYWFRRGVLAAEGMRNQMTIQNRLTADEAETRAARPSRVRELTPPPSPRRRAAASNLRRRTSELANSPIRTSGFQHFGPGIRIRAPQISSFGSGSSISSNNSFDTAPTFEGRTSDMMGHYPDETRNLIQDQRDRAKSCPPDMYAQNPRLCGPVSPKRTTIENRKKKKASPRNSQSSIESLRSHNEGIPTIPVGFPEVIRSRSDMEYGGDGGEVDLSLEDAFDDEGRPYSDSSSAEEDSSKDSDGKPFAKKKDQGGGRKRRKTRKKQKRRRK